MQKILLTFPLALFISIPVTFLGGPAMSFWDERTPPTTVLLSGLRLIGVEQWVKSLQAITGQT